MTNPTDIQMPRQPQPVHITAMGDLRDVDYYLMRIERCIKNFGDDTQRIGNQLIIYPKAVND